MSSAMYSSQGTWSHPATLSMRESEDLEALCGRLNKTVQGFQVSTAAPVAIVKAFPLDFQHNFILGESSFSFEGKTAGPQWTTGVNPLTCSFAGDIGAFAHKYLSDGRQDSRGLPIARMTPLNLNGSQMEASVLFAAARFVHKDFCSSLEDAVLTSTACAGSYTMKHNPKVSDSWSCGGGMAYLVTDPGYLACS